MSFYDTYEKYKNFDFDGFFANLTTKDVERAIESPRADISQLLALISPQAENYLEEIAQKAHSLTLRNFGKTIQLYTPMYLSNYCVNGCAYCGFNAANDVTRRKLTLEEVEKEARFIASTGLKHILVLTGEDRVESPVSYIADAVGILKKHFSSISIEVYPLYEEEYAELIADGVDGLTIYQETYCEEVYGRVHESGPKKDYSFRLSAPERALRKGMRIVNIGALFGLGDWRKEVFFTALHAEYLEREFPSSEISVSIPRLRPIHSVIPPEAGIHNCGVTDKNIAQAVLAFRLFLPKAGITLSTREDAAFRENLIPLGITKMSAGSTTKVGGHTIECADAGMSGQFEIFDSRDVFAIKKMLSRKGYDPILKNWA